MAQDQTGATRRGFLAGCAAAAVLGTPAAGTQDGPVPALRDPLVSPFAPDSLWHSPLGENAVIRPTDAFIAHIGATGDPIGEGARENVRVSVEENAITAALEGHPESREVREAVVRGGSSIGALWPGRADPAGEVLYAPDLARQGVLEAFRWRGFKLEHRWVKTNQPFEAMDPAERAAQLVIWEGGGPPWVRDDTLAGNGGLAVVGEHPVTGRTVVWQTLAAERPAPGSALYHLHSATPPNAPYALPSGAPLHLRGWLDLFAGPQSRELWPGALDLGAPAPRRATFHGAPAPGHNDPSRFGSHGGSGTSAIGGTVLIDELCAGGTAIDTIRHVLGLNIWSGFLAWRQALVPAGVAPRTLFQHNPFRDDRSREAAAVNEMQRAGCVWPAPNCDNDAWTVGHRKRYSGVDPAVTMGSLLMLPSMRLAPEGVRPFDLDALETLPARRLGWALQNFGGYVQDIVPDNRPEPQHHFLIACEERHRPYADDPHWTMTRHFFRRFGWPFRVVRSRDAEAFPGDAVMSAGRRAAAAWRADIVRIMRGLCVVTSNGPGQAGGGGRPIIEHRPGPVSAVNGRISIGSVPVHPLDITLHHSDGGRVQRDVFDRPLVNGATAPGAFRFTDLDRGLYRLAVRGTAALQDIRVELGRTTELTADL